MDAFGGRKFHGSFINEDFKTKSPDSCETNRTDDNAILQYINNNVIGKDKLFNGAFGDRRVLYCDYTASGRSLKFIEDYISENVLPHYGNTHTSTSITSLQTSMFRQESRDLIRQTVNAQEHDAVIFTSNGCTGAVHKLLHALNLKAPPIVFVSPYEHHSNLLPWKEIGSKIVWSRESENGSIDLEHIETLLKSLSMEKERPILGCFAAASNVTGHLVDVDSISHLFHKYNGFVFFDYATAGPYVEINMNPSSNTKSNVYKDAIFISPHKFVGGPQTPGILVAKKNLFANPIPSRGGGGSVFFVTESSHRYLKDIEMREEGGTPAIIESIRAGLVFQLKDTVGIKNIAARDQQLIKLAERSWSSTQNLVVLGNKNTIHANGNNKLPIFSFLIKHKDSQRFLHHNYVSVLLNDLFGIQSRGGCACAGPYAQQLLGMDEDVALQIESLLLEDQRLDRHHLRRHREHSDKEILRPGFTRLNLPYFFTDEEIEFVIEAVKMIADKGWKLLPQYLFDPETGEWKHKDHKVFKDRKWLGSIKYTEEGMTYSKSSYSAYNKTYKELLKEADSLFEKAHKMNCKCGDQTVLFGEEGERFRWFLLPCEAQDYLNGIKPLSSTGYTPKFYPGQPVKQSVPGINRKFEDINRHYCTCMPYRENISVRVPLPRESPPLTNGTMDANDIQITHNLGPGEQSSNNKNDPPEIAREEELSEEMEEKLTINGHLEASSTDDGETCTLLCKPVPKRTLNLTTDDSSNSPTEENKDNSLRFHNPPKDIFKPAVEGIEDFQMIEDGDRVLICLSGGKDSLSMLHIIRQYQFYAKGKNIFFQFGAMTVDPQSAGYDPSPLIGYCKSLGVEYHYEEQDIIGMASNLPVCESICSFCSRMKRGRIYACARREKYNVIALGQHLDDIAESFLMSTFHNGYLRSMKANYKVTEGDLRVVRPLIYVREKNLRAFAEKVRLPVIPENCPACFEAPKERHRMKQLLAHQEVLFPNLFQSLRSALHPLISKSKTGMEKKSFLEEEEKAEPGEEFM
ncbi:uncharacterized protein [Clytia hemisphaerica]|uniref:Uncharacterized protein n=1 Tax=Clytia hemisphaerica TaxID=252671 RepID=A0A7M5WZA0_9CNID